MIHKGYAFPAYTFTDANRWAVVGTYRAYWFKNSIEIHSGNIIHR